MFLQVIEEELSSSGKDDVPYKIRKSQEPDQILMWKTEGLGYKEEGLLNSV